MSPSRPSVPGPEPFRPGRFAVLILLGLLAAPALFAADPLAEQPPFSLSPADLLAAARPAEPAAATAGDEGDAAEPPDAEILYRATTFTFRADGARTLERYEVLRIDTAAGAEGFSEISTEYAPWHQERPTLRARVVTHTGREHPLDPATLSEVSLESDLPDVYQDRLRIRAPLPAVEPGAVVETLVRVVDREPLFAAGTVYRELLAGLAPIRHLQVTLEYPESLALRHVVALPSDGAGGGPETSAEPVVERAGGRVRQVFERRDVAPLELPAPGLPSDEARYPYVAFTTGRSWAAMARAYSQVVDAQIAASDLGNVEIPGAGLASQWEQIAARVAWMQRSVRYTGVNLGEAAIVPRPPAQTLARRYGDCKDKATLLVAALRDLGVPAYVALLRAGTPDDIDAELPGLGAGGFDHAIVYVPGHPALWIDATDPYSVLGELPTPDQGRLALVASPNTDRLVRTPVATADDNRIEETREVTLAEFGPGRVVETSRMTGAPAREIRGGLAGATEEQVEKNLASYAETAYGTASATEIEHSAADDLSGPATTRFVVDDAQWAQTDLGQGVVVIPRASLLERLPYAAFWQDDEDERTSDFIVDEPYEVVWHYRIRVPEGFAPRELPEEETRTLGPARYTARFQTTDDGVEATLGLRIDARRISAEQLAALRDGVKELQEDGNLVLWFDQVGASLLAAGRVGDAFDELRRLAALHPDEALHRVQLAQAALAGGLIEEARRQARKAVELDPDWFLSHQTLGLMLLHGTAGRQFRAGFDRAGAIAAFERARELAPDKFETVINLALLHEYDDQGRRYRDPEELAQAIDTYRSVEDRLAGTRYVNNLALALFFSERNQEVFDLLEDKASDPLASGLLAAAEAMVKSPRAAIRRADRAFANDGAQRAQALITGGQMLAGRRHYPEAAQLLRAASTSSANPAQLQAMLRLIDNAKPWQEVTIDPESPTSLLRQLMLVASSEETVSPEDIADLLADVWKDDLSNPFLDDFIDDELQVATPGDPMSQTTVVDAVFDMIFAAGELVPEELPGIGWAVRMKTDLPMPGKDKGMIVVREHGGYRFAASESDPASLGHFALDLARKGSVQAARPWLDHAFELTEAPEDWDLLPTAGELFHAIWEPAPAGAEDDGEAPPADLDDRAAQAARAGEADRIELGAAVLSSSDFADEQVVEVLRRARDAASDGDGGDDTRIALDYALAKALLATEDSEALLEVGRRIEEETEEDFYTLVALEDLRRYDEVLALAARKLDEDPDDFSAIALRVETLLHQGKLDEAAAEYDTILERPNPPAALYNEAAWLAVVREAVDERAIQWAQQAVQKTDYGEDTYLHTLATVYAEAGRPEEAHKVILQTIESRPGKQTETYDWYVFGRIAEQYGLPESAREYYRMVEPTEGEAADSEADPMSTRALAERRLKALGG